MPEILSHIDLFSGIGGFALAAQWAGFWTVAFCEIEPYCQEILKERFGAVADYDGARLEKREGITGNNGTKCATFERSCCPILYSDIRSFPASRYRGATLLTGGFPCQPFSQAGKRRGKEDDRYLWPEMLRVISEARPTWVLGENVAGIVTMELDRVLSDLESEGYSCQSFIIPACAVDAKHRRDRVWIVGHTESGRQQEQREPKSDGKERASVECSSQDVADAKERTIGTGLRESEQAEEWGRRSGYAGSETHRDACKLFRLELAEQGKLGTEHYACICDFKFRRREEPVRWLPEPNLGRVAHGVPNRVHRLKGLGNSIVPQVAYEIIAGIAEIEMRDQITAKGVLDFRMTPNPTD